MRKGFTLLEIIIVIVVIGVLASLALPRFFRVIERSRAAEALAAITTIRRAVETCYILNNGDYWNCRARSPRFGALSFDRLGIDDPGSAPNAHFDYIVSCIGINICPTGYVIQAVRNTLNGGSGNPQDSISFVQDEEGNRIVGMGVYFGYFQ